MEPQQLLLQIINSARDRRFAELDQAIATQPRTHASPRLATVMRERVPRDPRKPAPPQTAIEGHVLPSYVPLEPHCEFCHKPNGYSGDHTRGCPSLPQPTRAELLDLALACEAGWVADRRRNS